MQQGASQAYSKEFMSAQLKRALWLARRHLKAKVEPDGSLSYVHSSVLRRLLFGRVTVEAYKVMAGIPISLRQRELRVRLSSPVSVEFYSASQDQVQHSVSTTLAPGPPDGLVRQLNLTNASAAPIHVRALTLVDPSSLNFRRENDPPGEIGMNAFNRGDHVVLDDVGDGTGSRIVAFSPAPSVIYMTRDGQRALDAMAAGELPESVAGMSGAVILLAQQDVDIAQGSSAGLRMAALYDESSLGNSLSLLPVLLSNHINREGLGSGARASRDSEPTFACSDPAVNFSFSWAKAALDAFEGEFDALDRLCAGMALGILRPDCFVREFQTLRSGQARGGFLARAGTAEAGPLETAIFIVASCRYLALKNDRSLTRRWYPALRKAAKALAGMAKGGLIESSTLRPDGWRRRLPSGFPTGATSELNVIVAGALGDAATVAFASGKAAESASFREAEIRLLSKIDQRLRDQTGGLALNLDPKGRIHPELTIDQAVALYFNPFDHKLAASTVHRLLEKDFESGYGPRCVPTSNTLYYHPSYGDGQLGSCWTRAALAWAVLAYGSGYPTIGALQLERLAKLVHSGWEKLGGAPGEFPFWYAEHERRAMDGSGSDLVAAARFVEGLILGELGLSLGAEGPRLVPPSISSLPWLLVHNLSLAEKGSLFLGRSPRGAFTVSTYRQGLPEGSLTFSNCAKLDTPPGVDALQFWDASSMVICVGCSDGSSPAQQARAMTLAIPITPSHFASSIFVDLAGLNQETGFWTTLERMKAIGAINIRMEIAPGAWKAFRLTPANREVAPQDPRSR